MKSLPERGVHQHCGGGESAGEERRLPLSDAYGQVAEDFTRLREMGVDEVFFDMNRFSASVEEQFRLLERLHAAAA